MSDKVKRPHRTSMEGMIWNANHVLQDALRPGIRGVPKAYFMECAGIAIISVVDVGLIFSGTVGTGILMAHMDDDSWSSPVACGLTGVGFGLLMGAAAKELIVFFPDALSIKTFFGPGVQLKSKTELTVGVGRELDGAVGWSTKGNSAVISFAYSKGAFVGLSMETAVVAPRTAVNTHFYGQKVDDLMDIIRNKVKFPADKQTLLPDVHEKLKKLSHGISETPAQAEAAKVEAARIAADEAAQEFHKTDHEEVVEVDAEEEAAKDPVDELALASVSISQPPSEMESDTPADEVSESLKDKDAAAVAEAAAEASGEDAALDAAKASAVDLSKSAADASGEDAAPDAPAADVSKSAAKDSGDDATPEAPAADVSKSAAKDSGDDATPAAAEAPAAEVSKSAVAAEDSEPPAAAETPKSD